MEYLSPHHLSADGQAQTQLHHPQQLNLSSPSSSSTPAPPPAAPATTTTTTSKKIYHDFTMEDAEVIGGLCRLQDCVRPTSPRSQMEREKRIRREIANSNERRRMQSINTGFQVRIDMYVCVCDCFSLSAPPAPPSPLPDSIQLFSNNPFPPGSKKSDPTHGRRKAEQSGHPATNLGVYSSIREGESQITSPERASTEKVG